MSGLSQKRLTLIAAACFLNVVLAVMGDLLLTGGPRIISHAGGGIDARFASLRAFTANTLAGGELPLWNPTIFSGTTHLGGFESGLYYPPNVLYRIFPVPNAINIEVALHLFLFGLLTYLWLARQRIHPFACIYGGVVAMLSGVFFLHAASGDLAVLEAFTWCPAALIAMHALARGQFAFGVIGGTLAVAMPVFCGYPIAAVYTGFAVALYGGFLFASQSDRGAMFRGAAIILAVAPFLTAVQLWIGLESFARSARYSGDSTAHVGSKALVAPDFFSAIAPWGDGTSACLFIGVITLLTAVYGLVFGARRFRYAAAAIAGVLLLIAYVPGRPFFGDLADAVPMLRYIVHPNLFAIPAMLFVIALSCLGLDRLINAPASAGRMAGVAIGFTVLLCAGAVFAYSSGDESDTAFRGLLLAAGVSLCAATLLSLVPVNRWFRFGVLALGLLELYAFAVTHRTAMPLETSAASPRDERELDLAWRNPEPGANTLSASGNAALPSRRYLSLLARTQWTSQPHRWDGPFEFVGYHPLLRVLRVATVVSPDNPDTEIPIADHLPRFLLMHDYAVAEDRAEAFALMDQPTFDPWRTVVLERPPTPVPQGDSEQVAIGVSDERVNAVTLELNLSTPAILLITDAYDRGWRAYGLTGSSQWQYDVMPADGALRAIPLGAGAHRIRLVYAPLSFRIGQWVSVVSIAVLAFVAGMAVRRRRANLAADAPAEHTG